MREKIKIGDRVQVVCKAALQKSPSWNTRKSAMAGMCGEVTDVGYSAAEGVDVAEIRFDGHKKPSRVKWRPEELRAEISQADELPAIVVEVSWGAKPGDDLQVQIDFAYNGIYGDKKQTLTGASELLHNRATGGGMLEQSLKMVQQLTTEALMDLSGLEALAMAQQEDPQMKLEE